MTLEFDESRVLANARTAETFDLIDRVTAYRAGLEPAAIPILEDELRRRGVTPEEIAEQSEIYDRDCLRGPDGAALKCSFCRRPAVAEGWGRQTLFGIVPLLPRKVRFCKDHRPDAGFTPS
jgi:hypothetical protein